MPVERAHRDSRTGVVGVYIERGWYHAHIMHKGQRRFLGRYKTLKAAAAVRRSAELDMLADRNRVRKNLMPDDLFPRKR